MELHFPNVFFLRARDPATYSLTMEVRFEIKDFAELRLVLGMSDDEFVEGRCYKLEYANVAKIVSFYRLSFEPGALPVELHPWHPYDDRPYRDHTDRELALMLAGIKPLSAFTESYPSLHGFYNIPEHEFEPYVTSGRIIKREHIEPGATSAPHVDGRAAGVRRVLFALRGEEWRIDAYLLLWKTADKSGWNEGFERMQGSLLGYEDWQNDFHIEQVYFKGNESGKP